MYNFGPINQITNNKLNKNKVNKSDYNNKVSELENNVDELEKDLIIKINNKVEQSNYDLKIEELENKNSLQDSQISQMIQNPGTATEGNSELLNIRVGYDGKNYDTAGNAVREQISDLNNSLNTPFTILNAYLNFEPSTRTISLVETHSLEKGKMQFACPKILTNIEQTVTIQTTGLPITLPDSRGYYLCFDIENYIFSYFLYSDYKSLKNRNLIPLVFLYDTRYMLLNLSADSFYISGEVSYPERIEFNKKINSLELKESSTLVLFDGAINFDPLSRTLSLINFFDFLEPNEVQLGCPKLTNIGSVRVIVSGLPITLPDGRGYYLCFNIENYNFFIVKYDEVYNLTSKDIPLVFIYGSKYSILDLAIDNFYVSNQPWYISRKTISSFLNAPFSILNAYINYDPNTRTASLVKTYGVDKNKIQFVCPKIVQEVSKTATIDVTGLPITLPDYYGYYLCFNVKTCEFSIILFSQINNLFQEGLVPLVFLYGSRYMLLNLSPDSFYVSGEIAYPTMSNINDKIDSKLEEINNKTDKKTIDSMLKNLINFNEEPFKIVLGGDSITHGVGGSGFAQDGETIINNFKRNTNGYCWAKLFKEYIENNYNATVTNNACTGTNSSFWNNNKATLIPSDTDLFILTIGTNDRNTSISNPATKETILTRYEDNLKSIVNYCNNLNINIILVSPIPASEANENLESSSTIRLTKMFEMQGIVQKVAESFNMEYINLYNLLYYYYWIKDLNFEDYFADGLHPNDSMYKTMFYLYLYGLGLAPTYKPVE